ncbi:hypothetical protein HBI67_151830 [Parastagonospora nodorum]|nr:hypothetical protein HBH51_115360 [Parastagonospora nodorum]KAH3971748.1 hypothetical protein HBH52_157620 [Parastagonospora nodorum]KAH4097475.1 hypothetical protein HBH46_160620 [Parastagonospora nodorum]KAH4171233.1 hypothetical protein HBH43_095790 [Parastagonospora nodorum]KAH4931999.1 hypothetical protein HBI79_105080 [Parastagonospora nodorum]
MTISSSSMNDKRYMWPVRTVFTVSIAYARQPFEHPSSQQKSWRERDDAHADDDGDALAVEGEWMTRMVYLLRTTNYTN